MKQTLLRADRRVRLPGDAAQRPADLRGAQAGATPRSYAFFATRYGGMDTRFCLDGKWLDTPAGIAHYLEHKMFDTKEGNALQELAKNGAEPNAFTSNAMTGYYFDSTEQFEENLEILLSFVSIPYFTEESVAKEQGIIGQEIRMIEDNPDWQLYTRMMQALYQNSTARTSIAGTVESISHITAETLYDCHKAFYTPSNMILTVVGNVDPVHVADLARSILPREGGPVIPRDYGAGAGRQVAEKETRLAMEVSTPQFLTGFKCDPGGGRGGLSAHGCSSATWPATSCWEIPAPCTSGSMRKGLINTSFGGAFEMMPGVAYLYAGGDSKDARRAVAAEIQKEAERLAAEGIDEDYYQRVRRASFGANLRGLNSFENIAVTLTEGYFHGYDPFRFPQVFDSITKEDVCRLPAGQPDGGPGGPQRDRAHGELTPTQTERKEEPHLTALTGYAHQLSRACSGTGNSIRTPSPSTSATGSTGTASFWPSACWRACCCARSRPSGTA